MKKSIFSSFLGIVFGGCCWILLLAFTAEGTTNSILGNTSYSICAYAAESGGTDGHAAFNMCTNCNPPILVNLCEGFQGPCNYIGFTPCP